MQEDTYGGKTPEETLQMFIEALKKEDIELASRYFMLETDTQNPDYLTRNKIIKVLGEEKQKGRLRHIVEILSQSVPDSSSSLYEGDYGFIVYEKGEIISEINMELNKQSGVWKIQSL
jgi:HEAT repeat protein